MPSITRRRAPNLRPAGLGRGGDPGRDATSAIDAPTSPINGANFTELGVQQISTEAGVARSTFYAHFRDKVDLVLKLATELVTASFDITVHVGADGRRSTGSRTAFLRVLQVYREHAGVVRAIAEVASYDATVRELLERGPRPLHRPDDRRTARRAGRRPRLSRRRRGRRQPPDRPRRQRRPSNASPPPAPTKTPPSPANWRRPGGTAEDLPAPGRADVPGRDPGPCLTSRTSWPSPRSADPSTRRAPAGLEEHHQPRADLRGPRAGHAAR